MSFGASTQMTITLSGLDSSTAGVGRASTLVDNSSSLYRRAYVYYTIQTNSTAPTDAKTIQFYGLQGDVGSSSNIRSDGAQETDNAITIENSDLLHVVSTDATASKIYSGSFVYSNLSPQWGVAVVQDTEQPLLSGAQNNDCLRFVGET